MASNSIALKQWRTVISKWPVDKVRPEAVSFQTLMQKRLDKYENPQKAIESTKVSGNDANVQPVKLTWDESKEMKQVSALDMMLDNRFGKAYPMPDSLRFPASGPTHYDTILKESEKAPERGLLTKITNKLKGMVRLT